MGEDMIPGKRWCQGSHYVAIELDILRRSELQGFTGRLVCEEAVFGRGSRLWQRPRETLVIQDLYSFCTQTVGSDTDGSSKKNEQFIVVVGIIQTEEHDK